MDNIAAIITALTPLLVGVLAATASLAGVHINNKRQDKRALYDTRSEAVSNLFAHINELERSIIRISLCLKMNNSVDEVLRDSLDSVKKIGNIYDKSVIFFPESISKIVDSIIFEASALNANILMTTEPNDLLDEVERSTNHLKNSKKELREVFQIMMGIKK